MGPGHAGANARAAGHLTHELGDAVGTSKHEARERLLYNAILHRIRSIILDSSISLKSRRTSYTQDVTQTIEKWLNPFEHIRIL